MKILEFLQTCNRNQFVDSMVKGVFGIYAVVLGSGQGLPHSGAVSDAAFLWSNELNGLQLARSEFRASYSIELYLRYRDNLMFVVKDADAAHHLLRNVLPNLVVYKGEA